MYSCGTMEYIPKETSQAVPPPTYELAKDVTGKPPVQRAGKVLVDKAGNKVQLPYPPKSNCKKCRGLGYLGTDVKSGRFIICKKCYPMV